MVRCKGQESGVGVWELDGHGVLHGRVEDAFEEFRAEQELVDETLVDFSDAHVVGSFGDGSGVLGKSDLDLVLSVHYMGDHRSNDFSQFLRFLAGHLKEHEDEILTDFEGVDELDVLAYPMLEVRRELKEMATHESVETFYSLGEDEREAYFPHDYSDYARPSES